MSSPIRNNDSENSDSLLLDKIPVENVWLLFLYAFDLAQFRDHFKGEVNTSPDYKALIARLLCHVTEKRLRRNLSFGYRNREDVLRRVRGRIDVLRTFSNELLKKGEIACRFEELTVNTPRNRLVRAALSNLVHYSASDQSFTSNDELVSRCRSLAHTLSRLGVSGNVPSRAEIASDQIAQHQAEDRLMVSLAQAVFALILPTERVGYRSLLRAWREIFKPSVLFEKAIANFYVLELPNIQDGDGWSVHKQKQFDWPIKSDSQGNDAYLPIMKTDIFLINEWFGRRIVIDTKFKTITKNNEFGDPKFISTDLYQIYSYVRSQDVAGNPMSQNAEGILLYPSIGEDFDEEFTIQGHRFRFVTINLKLPSNEIVQRLRQIPNLTGRVTASTLPN